MGVKINIIAAVGNNLAIGNKGRLLWHISGDLRYFKEVTMGWPVIMGRKTYESIGRPLPGRLNIVVTHNVVTELPEGVVRAGSLEEAVDVAKDSVAGRKSETVAKQEVSERRDAKSDIDAETSEGDGNIFIIGGAEIYRQAIGLADRMYITHVYDTPDEADAFFPFIDIKIWNDVSCSDVQYDPRENVDYEFIVYERDPIE